MKEGDECVEAYRRDRRAGYTLSPVVEGADLLAGHYDEWPLVPLHYLYDMREDHVVDS